MYELLVACLGIAVGIVLGLTGAGGAVLSVPLLTLVLHLPMVEAAPIALLAVAVSAGLGALAALRIGILRYKAASLMATAGAIASPIGITVAHHVPNRPLTAMFAVVLVWIGIRSWIDARRSPESIAAERLANPPPCVLNRKIGRLHWTWPCAKVLAGSGLVAGFLSGLLGVGGGFILNPALRKYTDLEIGAIVATSMGVLTLISGLGAAVSALHDPINLAVGVPFIAGAIAGMFGGRYLSAWLTGPGLQKAFGTLALVVAGLMIVRAAG
jgi:uncharacterized membrane protein YfcA